MGLVRILVDGYSLLHGWPDLAPGKPRHCAAARDELIARLTLYRDVCGTPITVVFDGSSGAGGPKATLSTPEVEVLFSRAGQTADDLIERAACRFRDYGEVLVVTDDFAERDVVNGFGGLTSSCENFIRTIAGALSDLERDVQSYNQRERTRFRSH